jgi:hypothetical protein
VPGRLTEAGFADVDVRSFELGWICRARAV